MPQRALMAIAGVSRCWKLKSRMIRWQETQENGEPVPLKQEAPDLAKLPLWLLSLLSKWKSADLEGPEGQGRAASSPLQGMCAIRFLFLPLQGCVKHILRFSIQEARRGGNTTTPCHSFPSSKAFPSSPFSLPDVPQHHSLAPMMEDAWVQGGP